MDYVLKVNKEEKPKVIKDIYLKTAVIHLLLSLVVSLVATSILLLWIPFSQYILTTMVITLILSLYTTLPVFQSMNINHEEIWVEEEEFSYSYAYNKGLPGEENISAKEKEEFTIRFDEIRKIEINHIYNTITIYGPMTKRIYNDYENNRIRKMMQIENPKNHCTILPVFDEVEQFARFVSNKSGKTLMHVRYPWLNKSGR